jgi:hypothetical protein
LRVEDGIEGRGTNTERQMREEDRTEGRGKGCGKKIEMNEEGGDEDEYI